MTEAPKTSIYWHWMSDLLSICGIRSRKLTVKKNVTLADAVGLSTDVPLKLSKMAIIIIENPRPKLPHIIGFRRPMRSTRRDGTKEPRRNMIWMLRSVSLC